MNAILREECEAFVLTNEAIELHLSYLRPAIAELPELRKEMRALDEKLSAKIDQANKDRAAGDATLAQKIDASNAALTERIDQANKDREAGDVKLGEKIDRLAERFMALQASQKGLKWLISSLAVLASGASVAHSLGWI